MAKGFGEFDYDLAIVGGGSAGYAAARTAASAGLRAVVIEGGAEVGGLCILRGCMPTKALLYAAEVMHLSRNAGVWGIQPAPGSFDFQQVMDRKNRLIAGFADFRHEQLRGGKFEFRRAQARFLDAHTLALSNGDRLSAAHFVICTGSRVAPSPLPQLDAAGYLTSDTALELKRLPKSLVVLGGGAVALEFAQFFARFGVEVTLVQRGPHVMRHLDADVMSEVEKVFRREGIRLFTGTKLLDARMEGAKKVVEFEHQGQRVTFRGDEILFGLGRVPNTEGLGLEDLGVELDGRRIVTDATLRSSVPHIFAAGDCTGTFEIVHLAVLQGEIAAHNIACPRQPKTMDYRLMTEILFTDPQVAVVGLTETQAQKEGIPYQAAKYPFNDHGKSLIMEALDGFVKLLADPASGEILGGACVGPIGGELIHEITVAMHNRMTVKDFATVPHYHPTLAEIWTYPAEDLAASVQSGARPSNASA